MRLTGRAALEHALAALFATIGADRLTLGRRDEAVPVGVQSREGGLCPGPGFGDHHRAAVGHPFGAGAGASRTAVGAAGAPIGASFGAVFPAGVELGLADDAVVVGVEPVEAGVGAPGAASLVGGAALLTGDGAVLVGVNGGETRDPGVDELGAAQAAVAIGVGAKAAGLRTVRGLLGDGDAARGGEGQGGQSARDNGLSHVDVSNGRPTRPNIPVWRLKRGWRQSPSPTGGRAASKATRAAARASASPAFRAS